MTKVAASTKTRSRTRGAFNPLYYSYSAYAGNGTIQATYTGSIANANGIREQMDDFVTRPFVAGTTWVNTPMSKRQETRSSTAFVGSQVAVPGGPTATSRYEGSSAFGPYDTVFDNQLSTLAQLNSSVISQACTKALSGVRRAEVSGLVTIAEMKETVQSLTHPLQGALSFLSRNVPGKKKRNRTSAKSVSASQRDIADQHLTIVFGLLPFISDIQGILKALRAIEPLPVVMTSRGEASYFDESLVSSNPVAFNDSTTIAYNKTDVLVNKAVSVRAYQQYSSTVTLLGALGLSISDVPKAAWQVATLSFVADWFMNVGDVISALTPQEGITYLGSGYTITETTSANIHILQTMDKKAGVSTGYWKGTWEGNQSRVVVATQRVPAPLGDQVRLVFKHDMHNDILDTFKVTALFSLITQRLHGLNSPLLR